MANTSRIRINGAALAPGHAGPLQYTLRLSFLVRNCRRVCGGRLRMRISRRQVLSMGSGAALVSLASLSRAPAAVAAPALVGLKKLDVRTLSFDCTNAG